MLIAALQMQSVDADQDANLQRIRLAAAQAAAQGARLVIAPELALSGYHAGPAFPDLAITAEVMEERLGSVARDHDLVVLAGFAERDGETVYNSALMTDGKGLSQVYRKSHLYGDYERTWFEPGRPESIIATIDGLKIGLLICYDVEFPENVRRLAQAGVDLVAVPTALPKGASGTFIANQMIGVRAFENQLFVAYVNHCGGAENARFAGLSTIAAPDGEILAKAPLDEEALLLVEIDPGAYARSRAENTYLADLAR